MHVVAASGSKVILVASPALTTLLFGIVTMLVDGDSIGWWYSGADVVAITVIVLDMVVTGGGIILVEMDGPPRT